MADSSVKALFGSSTDYLAVAGALSVSYVALKLCFSLLKAFHTYVLAKFSGIGPHLRSKGEWAVVTGATDGIGKEYALRLASYGLKVVLISRTQSKLEQVAKEIEAAHKVQTKIIAADFSSGPSIYDDIKSKLQGLDIAVLVNNVGLSYEYPEYFLELPDRDKLFLNLLNVNCTSVTLMSSIVMPDMVTKRKGVVINLASAAGTMPTPLLSVYSACKVYVRYLSECLEIEYANKGITIQCVNPYFVCSNMSKVRRPSLFIPSAKDYVKAAMSTIGKASVTYGYWPHALMDLIPRCIPSSLYTKYQLKVLLGANKRAKRRLESKKAN